MAKTLGINVNWNQSDSPTSARLNWIKNQGLVLIRSQQNSAANITTVFNNQGCYVMPLVTGTGFASYVDTLYTSGTAITGFCGVIEVLNEPYGTWASPHYANGGDYWDAVRGSIITAKAAHPSVKFLLAATAPGRPNGSSTPGAATWMNDIFARASQRGDTLTNLIYGFSIHGYTFGNNVLLKDSSGQYMWPSIPWQLKQINDFLVQQRATSLVVWDCESGAGEAGNGDPDASFSDATQQQWFQNKIAVFQNPSSYVPGISINWEVWEPFCLLSGGLPAASGNTDAKAWFLIEQNNFSDGPSTPPVKIRPALTDVRNCSNTLIAAGATGNFTGATTPPPTTDNIAIQLKATDSSKVQITHIPTGTQRIHVAFAQDNLGTGVEFLGYPTADLKITDFGGSWPATPFDYSNAIPADHPAVQMIAEQDLNATIDIGTWTPWVVTTPSAATPVPTATTNAATAIASTSATLNGLADLHGVTTGTYHFDIGTSLTALTQLPSPENAIAAGAGTLAFAAVNSGTVTGGTSINVAATNFSNGRYLVALVLAKGIAATQTTITPGAGYTKQLQQDFTNAANGAHRLAIYTKIASAEAATTWTFDQSTNHAVAILAFDGVDTGGTPFVAITAGNSQANGSALTCQTPSLSATSGQLMIYGGGFCNGDSVTYPTTTPASTERVDIHNGVATTDITLFGGTQSITSTGSTGTRTVTIDNGGALGADNSAGFAILLNPVTSGAQAVTWNATGLTSGSTYQYRLSVTDSGGTNLGSFVSFSTPPTGATGTAPSIITNDFAIVTDSTAALNGHVVPNGLATTYHFDYGRDTNYGTSTTSTSIGLSEADVAATLTGLTASTTYHFRVVATNSFGTTNGPDQTFTTAAAVTPPPPITDNSVTLVNLRSELKSRGFDFLSDDRCDAFINDALQELAEYAPWPFLETTTTGTAPLTISDLRQVLYVTDATTNATLVPQNIRDVAYIDPTLVVTGSPLNYWLDGNTINVWPNSTDTLTVRYIKVLPQLVDDSDVAGIPSRYNPLIVDLAQIRALGLDNDNWQQAQSLRAETDRQLAQMLQNLGTQFYDFPLTQRVFNPEP